MSALLVDIGNSRVKWRVIDLATGRPRHEGWTQLAQAEGLADRWRAVGDGPVATVCYCNVAAERAASIVEGAARRVWPGSAIRRIVSGAERCGIVNGYRDPTQLGADRWIALIGARRLFPGTSLLVCSFGTATTIDLLLDETGKATFVGGLILPGVETMTRSLASGTARLSTAPGVVTDFADSTSDAIASGILRSQVGAVEQAVRHARASSRGGGRSLSCLLAGGHATWVAPHLTGLGIETTLVEDLVLRGLAIVAVERDGAGEPRTPAIH